VFIKKHCCVVGQRHPELGKEHQASFRNKWLLRYCSCSGILLICGHNLCVHPCLSILSFLLPLVYVTSSPVFHSLVSSIFLPFISLIHLVPYTRVSHCQPNPSFLSSDAHKSSLPFAQKHLVVCSPVAHSEGNSTYIFYEIPCSYQAYTTLVPGPTKAVNYQKTEKKGREFSKLDLEIAVKDPYVNPIPSISSVQFLLSVFICNWSPLICNINIT